MTPLAAAFRRTATRVPAAARRRWRTAHPVRRLRWFRNGVLLAVLATELLYAVVANQAGHRISAAERTGRTISDVRKASAAALRATRALDRAFTTEDVTLIGTGTAFVNTTAQVNTDVTAAAEGNAAGARGETELQFVQGQLATCVQLAETAVATYDNGSRRDADASALEALTAPDQKDRTGASIADTGGLIAALDDLEALEAQARHAQLSSRWLAPACFWTVLLTPVLVMLVLTGATGYVLAGHFRRHLSPLLLGAVLLTTAVAVTGGALVTYDGGHPSAAPLAGHWVTLASGLLLLAAAAVLAYLAYRPRLAEYRFRPS